MTTLFENPDAEKHKRLQYSTKKGRGRGNLFVYILMIEIFISLQKL